MAHDDSPIFACISMTAFFVFSPLDWAQRPGVDSLVEAYVSCTKDHEVTLWNGHGHCNLCAFTDLPSGICVQWRMKRAKEVETALLCTFAACSTSN